MKSNEVARAGDRMDGGAVMNPALGESIGAPRFCFDVVCLDRAGAEKWRERISNLVTTEGKNSLLDVYFDAATQITAWYCGLKGSGTAAAGDTLASHAGWSEVTAYSGNRKALTFGEPSSGSLAASAAASFAINGDATVAGALIASVDTGSSGVLYSAGNFASPRTVANGDTVNVTPTLSFT